jgi:GntR family transcriptional regulator
VIPIHVEFRAGIPLFEQIVYASTKAVVSGRLRPGDPFPSVRALSKDLKINPNTAAKVIAHLIAAGLIESRPGIGTVVATIPDSTPKQRTHLLENEIEALVVEGKRLGIELEEMLSSISDHWKRLSDSGVRRATGVSLSRDGDRKK